MRVTTGARTGFAASMAGLGILGFVYGDFALVWQPVPAWVPGRQALAYFSAAIELAGGLALLWSRTAAVASRVLLVYVWIWLLLLRVPELLSRPLVEGSWLGCGETAMIAAGAWALFAMLTSSQERSYLRFITAERGVHAAQVLFGLAVLPVGLSHWVYTTESAQLVPAFLPWHVGLAHFTGAAYIAAGAAILTGFLAAPAARLCALMMTLITLLVWIPEIVKAPAARLPWTAFVISWTLAASAWVVADSFALRISGQERRYGVVQDERTSHL
jgi:uncharacterized membrane protein